MGLDLFHDAMLAALPRLRGLALTLTRSRTEAEDLVREVAVAALGGRHTFTPGTNFSAWLNTIMRNRARLDRQRRRKTTPPQCFGGWVAGDTPGAG